MAQIRLLACVVVITVTALPLPASAWNTRSHPLHTAQLFTVEYPQGDRGGNEICVRVTQAGQPMDLHRFWDGVITSSSNLTRLRNEATALRNRPEFQRSQLTELATTDLGIVG